MNAYDHYLLLTTTCPNILVQEPLEGSEQKSSTPSTHAVFGKGLSNGGLDPVCPQPPLSQNPQGNFFKHLFPHLPQNY